MDEQNVDLDRRLPSVTTEIFEAQQFKVIRGSELGYHCHVRRVIGDADTGILTTLRKKDVYAESHRTGKVKKGLKPEDISERQKQEIVPESIRLLKDTPEDKRRKPSKKAIIIGSMDEEKSL